MILLGIDGGGSKTRFLLEDDAGRQLALVETGPSNRLSVGDSEAHKSISSGLARLPAIPDIVCGGFAGAGRPESAKFYRDSLTSLLPKTRILVETDAFIAYVGALGVNPGVLLIAGTGSIAIARRNDGTMVRVGGWGYVFGDEGSGHWIGKEAIRLALRAQDTGETPGFVAHITQALNLDSIRDVVSQWNLGKVDVQSVAGLAKLVLEFPSEPANRIITQATTHLRSITEDAIRRAGLDGTCRKSVVGSVGSHPRIQEQIGLTFTPPDHPPERGALIWARSQATA